MKKRLLQIILILIIIFSVLPVSAFAVDVASNSNADILHELGLFNGVGTDSSGEPIYNLEASPSRQEAITMLIRLLGKESDAISKNYEHPFNDVDAWADKYVGYAYHEGLTNGISSDKFGGKNLATEQQYITFILRALNYSETDGDYTYATALSKAEEIGLLTSIEDNSDVFTRGSIVNLSYSALLQVVKGENESLANMLLWSDVFSTEQLDATHDGKLMLAADMPNIISNGVTVYNLEDLRELILLSLKNDQLGIGINVPGYSYDSLYNVYTDILDDYHPKAMLYRSVSGSYGYIYPHINTNDYMMMEYYYDNPKRFEKNWQLYRKDLSSDTQYYKTLDVWVKKVDSIVNSNTNSSMTEAQKVKALHDYLCRNTEYDSSYEGNAYMTPHFALQILFEGHGVCDGYSEAFKILMNGAGINCKVIYGDTPNGKHAWNQVKIDGVWYNIDVTWDDTIYSNSIAYNYFCVSDNSFLKDHWAEDICHAESCSKSLAY